MIPNEIDNRQSPALDQKGGRKAALSRNGSRLSALPSMMAINHVTLALIINYCKDEQESIVGILQN
jgi:hypothetical protein